MFNLTKTCHWCEKARQLLDELQRTVRDHDDEIGLVRGEEVIRVHQLTVACECCDGRGIILTREGEQFFETLKPALLEMIRATEEPADPCPPEEEVPL